MAAPTRDERVLSTVDLTNGRVLFAYDGLVSGDSGITWDNDTQTLTVENLVASTGVTLPDDIVTLTGTQVLTNKTLTSNPGVSLIARCTTALAKTNDNTPEAIPGLSLSLKANAKYRVRLVLSATGSAGGMSSQFVLSAAGVSSGSRYHSVTYDDTPGLLAQGTGAFTTTGNMPGAIGTAATMTQVTEAIIRTGATAPTLTVTGCQGVADPATTTFLVNSFIEAVEFTE